MRNHTNKDQVHAADHLPILKTNNLFCVYNMIELELSHLMPPTIELQDKSAYIFRKEASKPQLAVRIFLSFFVY